MGLLDKITGAFSQARSDADKALSKVGEKVSSKVGDLGQKASGVGEKVELFAKSGFEEANDYARAIGQTVSSAPGKIADQAVSAGESAGELIDRAKALATSTIDAVRGEGDVPGRALTEPEITLLRETVYGDSIDYSKVQIKEGEARLTRVSDNRPFTLGNTIYVPKDRLPLKPELLTHEMMHVWQYQNGGADYFPKALAAQKLGDGYDFEKGIAEGKAWSELNPEQQAELVEQANLAGAFDDPDHKFVYEWTEKATGRVSSNDYTDYLRKALIEIKAGRGAP